MAVNLVTVTGNLETLIGATPTVGRLWFKLSRPDWNDAGEIFAPEYVEAIAATDGSFSINLQSTDDFENGATYQAILKYVDTVDGKAKEFALASFAVPTGAGPYDLSDLLVAGTIAPVPADILALAQAAQIAATAAAAQAVAFGSIYTQTDAQLLSVTIPADVDVVQRMPSVAGQVAPPNIVSRWRRNASPGAEDFWTDATGATFTVAEITQAEILSTLTSALDAAFTDPAFSGQARSANGTQSAPSLTFASDLDTGVYRSADNTIAFTAGGTRRAFLSSTAMQVDVPITGTAVVSSDSDVTAGRLLKTAAGPAQAFRRGNILGTVSQSGGVPTGAVIERASNANGEYVRFADGTQICTFRLSSNSASAVTWTYPAAFSAIGFFGGVGDGPDRIVTQSGNGSAGTTTAAFHAWILTVAPIARTTYPCRLVAIGRWF